MVMSFSASATAQAQVLKPEDAEALRLVQTYTALVSAKGDEDRDAFGRAALLSHDHDRLFRLFYVADTYFAVDNVAKAREWAQTLMAEARKQQDLRYQNLATFIQLELESSEPNGGAAILKMRDLANQSNDWFVKAVGLINYYDFSGDLTQESKINEFTKNIFPLIPKSGKEAAYARLNMDELYYTANISKFNSIQYLSKIIYELKNLKFPVFDMGILYSLERSAGLDNSDSLHREFMSRFYKLVHPFASKSLNLAEVLLDTELCAENATNPDQTYSCYEHIHNPDGANDSIVKLIVTRAGLAAQTGHLVQAKADIALVEKWEATAPPNLRASARRIVVAKALLKARAAGIFDDVSGALQTLKENEQTEHSQYTSTLHALSEQNTRNKALSDRLILFQWAIVSLSGLALALGAFAYWRLVKLAKKYRAAQLRADTANQSKSEFLANISHEIRTPLNGILGMSQLMSADTVAPKQVERLQVVQQSGRVLMALLNDLLDLSRLEAGRFELEEVTFSLKDVIEGVRLTFSSDRRHQAVAFRVAVRPEAEGFYRGDPVRITQVLANLVSNAFKFTSEGEVSLTVEMEGSSLVMVVADTGLGMAPRALERIFEKFVQADASSTRRHGGAGLGLAICHELVLSMGGTITAESTPGKGSRFTVKLPLPRILRLTAPTLEDPQGAAAQALDGRKLKVLVAEDNATNSQVMVELLERIGCAVTLVDDGHKAVKAFALQPFDIALIDVEMPRLDGLDAVRLMRRHEAATGQPPTPMVAVTAAAMVHQLRTCLSAGFDARLTKPILAEDLYRLVVRLATQPPEPHPWKNQAPPPQQNAARWKSWLKAG